MRIACFLCGAPEPEHWRGGVGWLLLHCARCEASGAASLGGTDTVRLPLVRTPTQPIAEIERAAQRAMHQATSEIRARERLEWERERETRRRAELEERVNRELVREAITPDPDDDNERRDHGDADPLGGPGRPE